MPTQKKAYCFTLNNYTEDEYSNILRTCEVESRYAVVGREVGESGTPHLQGYIIFKSAYRFTTIKNRYLPRCHIEIAKGSAGCNRVYCTKDGDYREYGEIPSSGISNSRDELARRFSEECSNDRIAGVRRFAESYPGSWYFSGHNLLRNFLSIQPPIERPEGSVLWLYGVPGIGKSKRAHEMYPCAYVKDPRTKWWNGYMLEKEVIIDDFGPGGIDINHLLRWFDRYKCAVENKGGMIPLYADKFVVTSNFHPRDCFVLNTHHVNQSMADIITYHSQLPALERRIVIEEMK